MACSASSLLGRRDGEILLDLVAKAAAFVFLLASHTTAKPPDLQRVRPAVRHETRHSREFVKFSDYRFTTPARPAAQVTPVPPTPQ